MLRVLIVDDEPPSAEMIRLLLDKYFPAATVMGIAGSVSDALHYLKNQTIDLVFLDIALKGESGFDLLDKIENRSFQFITLSASRDYAYKTFEYGGSGYLLKPLNKTELMGALANIFHI